MNPPELIPFAQARGRNTISRPDFFKMAP
jgi:hypothetical protein